MNLGGPTGTFEVHRQGARCAEGEFLWPTLCGDPIDVVNQIERHLGLKPQSLLPSTTPAVLVMRVVSDLLASTCVDRTGLTAETAWFDWSGGSSVRQWAGHFGRDVQSLQCVIDAGGDWQSVYLEVADLLRVAGADDTKHEKVEVLLDLSNAIALIAERECVVEKVDLMNAYKQAGRRHEPLTARLLSRLGRG